ncbi:glycosyltransferase [Methylobacterium sp. R2-1]|uniref:glycosyltransferase n=1 Tax=Methylobacterium sp. R2-1 TaxID=2587064 RepID=UPI00182AA28C|nr:nucleotide disphospho-sugar-binding domain-containing protein [Methylobacterium sp. R2-1]MBB2963505.1 UDP:flavonoid glycosyltransferase YjiC (YdhE family) [Methylobacterium sp. R2-1]
MPSRLRHWLGHGADRVLIDPISLPPLNALRANLGLPPVKRLGYWWNSPLRMILMCPPWYVPRQPDGPRQATQVGFPMADHLGDVGELAPTLDAYLDAGSARLVFTYGSGMRQGAKFFRVAVEICRRMRLRGILLAREAEQVPASLPAKVIHVRSAPLSLLLPRCAALVHHGGIGTVAQARAAGMPQMGAPVAFSHFDDAQRLPRLDLGAVLGPHAFRPRRACREVEKMLASPAMIQARTAARTRMAAQDGVASACDEIKRVAGRL